MKTALMAALVLMSIHARAATPDYVKTCPGFFAPPLPVLERVNLQLPPAYRFLVTETFEGKAIKTDIEKAFGKQSRNWVGLSEKIGVGLENPYSPFFDLNKAAAPSTGRIELQKLWDILASGPAPVEALDKWTRSETHAILLYDILSGRGLKKYQDVLQTLMRDNLFFSDARFAKSSLITYAFEKEGKNHDITMLYRPAGQTEVEWFKKTDDERWAVIDGLKLRAKDFQPASKIAPTSLKPSYLSGYSVDAVYMPEKIQSWEVVHKGYEISRHRLMSEIREVTGIVRETHSLHVHTVFELPVRYVRFDSFRAWAKALNDTLYLRGMEEGLHGNVLTSIMDLREDLAKPKKWGMLAAKRLEDIDAHNSKFFSAGLRGKMYGPASSPEFIKIGIEQRDTTRNLDRLDASLENITESVADRAWEKLPDDGASATRLTTSTSRSLAALSAAGISPWLAAQFIRAEKSIGVPFLNLEQGPVFNYKLGRYEYASTDYAARAKKARVGVVKALKALGDELIDFKIKREKVEQGDVETAIQQILTEWARAARPSERFNF